MLPPFCLTTLYRFKGIKTKISVKLLEVQFAYDCRLKRKLNFDELIKSIKGKLKVWR